MAIIETTIDQEELFITPYFFDMQETHTAENAEVFFPKNATDIVVKTLTDFVDERYDQSTWQKRQQSQINSCHEGSTDTPEAYYGVAPVLHRDDNLGVLVLGRIIDPTKEKTKHEEEYALVMKRYPQEDRLDKFLERATTQEFLQCAEQITNYMIDQDSSLPTVNEKWDHNLPWGHPLQLEQILWEELSYLHAKVGREAIGKKIREEIEGVKNQNEYAEVSSTIQHAQVFLLQVFQNPTFISDFTQRIRNGHIIIGHGDYKPLNMFVDPSHLYDSNPKNFLKALDANQIKKYKYIDRLKNFALILTSFGRLANQRADLFNYDVVDNMIAKYLNATGQANESNLRVLDYYCALTSVVDAIMQSFDKTEQAYSSMIEADTYLDRVATHLGLRYANPAWVKKRLQEVSQI